MMTVKVIMMMTIIIMTTIMVMKMMNIIWIPGFLIFFLFGPGYHSYQAEEKVELNGLDHKTLQKHLTNQTTHQWLIQRIPHQAMPTKPMEPRVQIIYCLH